MCAHGLLLLCRPLLHGSICCTGSEMAVCGSMWQRGGSIWQYVAVRWGGMGLDGGGWCEQGGVRRGGVRWGETRWDEARRGGRGGARDRMGWDGMGGVGVESSAWG